MEKDVGAIKYVRKFAAPAYKAFKEDKTELAMEYKAKDNDVVLVSYPKTGSTWLQAIVWQILNKGRVVQDDFIKIPRIERDGPEVVDAMPLPRFYRHHLPFSHIKLNDNAKYLYIHRKPEDTFASLFHFSCEMSNMAIKLDSFFNHFVAGSIPFGNYFDHVLSASELKHKECVLLVSYEELNKDTRSGILKLARFLGENYLSELLADDERLLKDILDRTNFENMKKNCKYVKPVPGDIEKEINFYRKGVIGDGKKILSPEQLKKLQDTVKDKMADTDFIELWSS